MFRRAFSFGGLLLLAGAAVLVTPGSGQAQHHGGGGHGGGFSHGGFSHGGFHHGGFNHGGFDHGFHHSGFDHGFHHGGFWWYPRYYGSYGAWPYYGYHPYYGYSSNYYPYSYDVPSYNWSGPAYDSTYYGLYGQEAPSYPYGYTSVAPSAASGQLYYPPATVASDTAPAQPDNTAHVTVTMPADAEIWFQGTKTTSTGTVREYQSPPLAPGTRYTYELRARWRQNGHEVTQTQQVEVTAGIRVNVHFPVQPTKAATAPSH
jgi:uncharacterized protein (TIGR03000 family)